MSWNPTRLEKKNAQRIVPPNAGTRHSDIVKKYGGSSLVPAGSNKIQTKFGYHIPLFSCDNFNARIEIMYQSSSTGFGFNPTGDRTLLIRRGTLWVLIENDKGFKESIKLPEGNSFHAPKGTKYGLATSGVDGVELYVCETPGYDKDWAVIDEPVIGEIPASAMEESQSIVATPTVRKIQDPVTVAQAKEMAEAVQARRRTPKPQDTSPINANSTNSNGVNLRPSGPPREE